MNIKLLNSIISLEDLNNKVSEWTKSTNPEIIDVDFNMHSMKDHYSNGDICNQWTEYTICIIYKTK